MADTLRHGTDTKKSQLSAVLFYKDAAGKMDVANPRAAENDRNQALTTRAGFTRESREVDMITRLHCDIFFQERFMLNEVNTKICFIRNKDAFCLISTASSSQVVTHATLFIRKLKLSPTVFLAYAKKLESSLAKVSRAARRVQDVHHTYRLPGCNQRETVYRSTAETYSHRSRGQRGVQRIVCSQPIQL